MIVHILFVYPTVSINTSIHNKVWSSAKSTHKKLSLNKQTTDKTIEKPFFIYPAYILPYSDQARKASGLDLGPWESDRLLTEFAARFLDDYVRQILGLELRLDVFGCFYDFLLCKFQSS